MTDAERIAEFLSHEEVADVTGTYGLPDAEWVRRCLADDGPGFCKTLMATISDVRREEREACIAAIDAEQREWSGDHPRSALDCARERIVNRGAQ